MAANEACKSRILFIEDNIDFVQAFCTLLHIKGYNVQYALNGKTGLEMVKCIEPDIVICDIGLPQMSGYEVAQKVRALSRKELYIIALSGYAQDLTRPDQAVFNRYLVKPIDLPSLINALAQAEAALNGEKPDLVENAAG